MSTAFTELCNVYWVLHPQSSCTAGFDVLLWVGIALNPGTFAQVIGEMKTSPVQGVESSLTQQLLSLCKQFLLYRFNCHFRLLSAQARSQPFPEPSTCRGAEGSQDSLLPPTRVPLVWLWGKDFKTLFPPSCFTSGKITVCIYKSKYCLKPPQFSEFWFLHCISQEMLCTEGDGLLNLWE